MTMNAKNDNPTEISREEMLVDIFSRIDPKRPKDKQTPLEEFAIEVEQVASRKQRKKGFLLSTFAIVIVICGIVVYWQFFLDTPLSMVQSYHLSYSTVNTPIITDLYTSGNASKLDSYLQYVDRISVTGEWSSDSLRLLALRALNIVDIAEFERSHVWRPIDIGNCDQDTIGCTINIVNEALDGDTTAYGRIYDAHTLNVASDDKSLAGKIVMIEDQLVGRWAMGRVVDRAPYMNVSLPIAKVLDISGKSPGFRIMVAEDTSQGWVTE